MQKSVSEERYKWIGGSDIACILNISPFKTRYELLQEKAQLKEDTFQGNEYTEYGNVMEAKIRDYINKTYNRNFVEGQHIIECPDRPLGVRCHTDGEDADTILEVKTTSHVYDNVEAYQIYLCQLLYYMYNANKPKGMLAVYLRPDDMSEEFDADRLQVWHIDSKDFEEGTKRILDAVEEFLQDLQLMQLGIATEEEDFLPAEVVDASHAVLALENQLAEMKAIEAEIKERKRILCELMQEHNIKTWVTPNSTRITYVSAKLPEDVTITEFDAEAFKAEHPRLYKKFTTTRTEHKKGKSAYVQITLPKEK